MKSQVLIVHPDLALVARLHQLLQATANVAIGFDDTLEGAFISLEQSTSLDLCICDFHGHGTDIHVFLTTVRNKFPRARIIILTNPEIEEERKPMPGIVRLPVPLDESHFVAVCEETFGTLENCYLSSFRLGRKFRSDRWGDWYEAYDTSLKREVFITVIHSWATGEEALQFRMAATLRARAAHSHVQSVYLAGEADGRQFVCHEKWAMPNLLDLSMAGHVISPRLAAHILHTVGSVLMFWYSEQYSHVTIGPDDVSISPQGVVKVVNGVDPLLQLTPLSIGDLILVAQKIQSMMSTEEKIPLRLGKLFDQIRKGEQVVFTTNIGEITIELDRVHSPVTVANFLRYVDRGAYDGSILHHVIPGFVVQGGRFQSDLQKISTYGPIPNEASNRLLNLRGTIAMARGADPNSADSQFAFNVLDNKSLNRAPNRPGYAVFGKVVCGLEVIDAISRVQTCKRGHYHHMPLEPVVILHARRVDAISIAEVVSETYDLDIQFAPEKGISASAKLPPPSDTADTVKMTVLPSMVR